jgi:serine/threonine protein kinase
MPFAPDLHRIPGTLLGFTAPELIFRIPSEVTMAIDIWALGCTICQLLGEGSPFSYANYPGMFLYHLADILFKLGGKESVPERFWEAFCENGAVRAMDDDLQAGRQLRDWDESMRLYLRGNLPEEGGGRCP